MGDPRHPTKIVIVVEGGCVARIIADRDPGNMRFYIADYDNIQFADDVGEDKNGRTRSFVEEAVWIDTVDIRSIVNKKGGTKRGV